MRKEFLTVKNGGVGGKPGEGHLARERNLAGKVGISCRGHRLGGEGA